VVNSLFLIERLAQGKSLARKRNAGALAKGRTFRNFTVQIQAITMITSKGIGPTILIIKDCGGRKEKRN
jgi:hypothetical protein